MLRTDKKIGSKKIGETQNDEFFTCERLQFAWRVQAVQQSTKLECPEVFKKPEKSILLALRG